MIVYETPSQAYHRYVALLRSEVPFTFRTMAFAFLCGSILSFPVGLIFAHTTRPFQPPEWTEPIYLTSFLGSLAILPFWSHFALHSQPLLRRLGLRFGLLSIIGFILSGLLFPAL